MAKNTIGDIVSRLRNMIKAVRQDAFVTDRMLYSFFIKYAKFLMKREDGKNKLMAFSSVIQTMDYVELIEVDKVEACCTGITSDCTIKRTKEKLPVFMQGYFGPLIRAVTSIDGSEIMQPTTSVTYTRFANGSTFKYNKTKYYWFLNDYLYFPNLQWDAIRVEGIFDDDISQWTCEEDACIVRRDQLLNVPDYLLYEAETMTVKDLYALLQVPSDTDIDKENLNR
jgi:hypothetical protein